MPFVDYAHCRLTLFFVLVLLILLVHRAKLHLLGCWLQGYSLTQQYIILTFPRLFKMNTMACSVLDSCTTQFGTTTHHYVHKTCIVRWGELRCLLLTSLNSDVDAVKISRRMQICASGALVTEWSTGPPLTSRTSSRLVGMTWAVYRRGGAPHRSVNPALAATLRRSRTLPHTIFCSRTPLLFPSTETSTRWQCPCF
jgi:hypothetical protein